MARNKSPKPRFTADMFVASKFSTADEKADFANKLMAFIEGGFEEKKFTKALYRRLSLTFGFIAHYDHANYWAEYFTRSEDKARFLDQIASFPCYGDPEYTFSDVEKAVKSRVRHMGFVDYYADLAKAETEQAERATLARLQAKYDSSRQPTAPLSPSQIQSPLSIQLQPLATVPAEETPYLADISDEAEQIDAPQYSLFA
jgi:hypothetical protein